MEGVVGGSELKFLVISFRIHHFKPFLYLISFYPLKPPDTCWKYIIATVLLAQESICQAHSIKYFRYIMVPWVDFSSSGTTTPQSWNVTLQWLIQLLPYQCWLSTRCSFAPHKHVFIHGMLGLHILLILQVISSITRYMPFRFPCWDSYPVIKGKISSQVELKSKHFPVWSYQFRSPSSFYHTHDHRYY